MPKPIGYAEMDNAVAVVDPLGELVKNLFRLLYIIVMFKVENYPILIIIFLS